jgi:hypothetical protein
MALQAFVSVEAHGLSTARLGVWVMAGNTGEPLPTGRSALTELKLSHVPERKEGFPLLAGRYRKDRHNLVELHPRSKVEVLFPRPQDAGVAEEVALNANIVALARGEYGRVDDGRVESIGLPAALQGPFGMKLPGPVAAFATDGQKAERWLAVTIRKTSYRLRQSAVAGDTDLGRWPGKVAVDTGLDAGGKIPSVRVGVERKRG